MDHEWSRCSEKRYKTSFLSEEVKIKLSKESFQDKSWLWLLLQVVNPIRHWCIYSSITWLHTSYLLARFYLLCHLNLGTTSSVFEILLIKGGSNVFVSLQLIVYMPNGGDRWQKVGDKSDPECKLVWSDVMLVYTHQRGIEPNTRNRNQGIILSQNSSHSEIYFFKICFRSNVIVMSQLHVNINIKLCHNRSWLLKFTYPVPEI